MADSQRTLTSLGMNLSGWDWLSLSLGMISWLFWPTVAQRMKSCVCKWPGNTHPLLATHPHRIHQAGGDAIPEHDPNRDCEDCVGQARIRHYWSIRRNEKVEAYKL